MVEEITPNYYAAYEDPGSFNLTGISFLGLPQGCIGIRSADNDNPLQMIDQTDDQHTYEIEVIDNNHLTATLKQPITPGVPSYFSAILSADRTMVFWVNNTKPLP